MQVEPMLPETQEGSSTGPCDASLSTMTKIGEKISFLKRTYPRLEDGILIKPGYYGMVRARTFPWIWM